MYKRQQEGLDNNYGAQIGKTLMHEWGKSVTTRACARAAAGSDARMGGCSMPVVINSGSGNQGMTVSLPVIVFADEWEVSHEKLCRSLVVVQSVLPVAPVQVLPICMVEPINRFP